MLVVKVAKDIFQLVGQDQRGGGRKCHVSGGAQRVDELNNDFWVPISLSIILMIVHTPKNIFQQKIKS